MYISRIVISGFRNFRELDLFELPPSIVVVGENGAGKSNLLHALRLVLDPSLPDTARQLSAEDFWDGLDAPFAGEEITISVDLVDFEGDQAAMAILGDYLIATVPKVARLTYAYRPRPLVETPASEADYEAVVYGGDRDDRRFAGVPSDLHGGSVTRLSPQRGPTTPTDGARVHTRSWRLCTLSR